MNAADTVLKLLTPRRVPLLSFFRFMAVTKLPACFINSSSFFRRLPFGLCVHLCCYTLILSSPSLDVNSYLSPRWHFIIAVLEYRSVYLALEHPALTRDLASPAAWPPPQIPLFLSFVSKKDNLRDAVADAWYMQLYTVYAMFHGTVTLQSSTTLTCASWNQGSVSSPLLSFSPVQCWMQYFLPLRLNQCFYYNPLIFFGKAATPRWSDATPLPLSSFLCCRTW